MRSIALGLVALFAIAMLVAAKGTSPLAPACCDMLWIDDSPDPDFGCDSDGSCTTCELTLYSSGGVDEYRCVCTPPNSAPSCEPCWATLLTLEGTMVIDEIWCDDDHCDFECYWPNISNPPSYWAFVCVLCAE